METFRAKPMESRHTLRIGLTERHGLAEEFAALPPPGVEFSFLTPSRSNRWVRSPIKGFLAHFESGQHDLLEAVLCPIVTPNRWICHLPNYEQAIAFDCAGVPVPRRLRLKYIERLFCRPNLAKLIFRSRAGLATFTDLVGAPALVEKATVVYPAVRETPDDVIAHRHEVRSLLFTGDFFRKGGLNVLDAFERLQPLYPKVRLHLCCDEGRDFRTGVRGLRESTLRRIECNNGILWHGHVTRHALFESIYPQTDIYLMPTYVETFGFALLEAMAFGLPIISTNYFAIPEILEDEVSGLLIDTRRFDCEHLFRGYVVNTLPQSFREYMTESTLQSLRLLLDSRTLRQELGRAALKTARARFSFAARNEAMRRIYGEIFPDFAAIQPQR